VTVELFEQRNVLLLNRSLHSEGPSTAAARARSIFHRFEERVVHVFGQSQFANPAGASAVEDEPNLVSSLLELLVV
jgi:hypothetical protein